MPAVHPNRKGNFQKAIEIPILCKFWREDDVWNGEAVHLPVVVFGPTLEEAMHNLQDALLTHLDAEQHVGSIDKTVEYLKTFAKESYFNLEEMVPNRFLSRFNVAVQNQRVMELV